MNSEHYAERLERGKKFSAWLRRVTTHPSTKTPAKPSEIARAIGASASRVGVLLNNCTDHNGLISLPREAMIDKIAQKYNANADEAKAIVGIMPKEDVKNIFILEPGSVVYKTSTGYTIIAPANDPDAPRRVNLINAYLLGLEDGREQRD